MKIVHLCLGAYYADDFSYQENLLPKYHKLMGNDVEIIASQQSYGANGEIVYLKDTGSYINSDGIKVTRIKYGFPFFINKYLKKYKNVYKELEKSSPNVLFIHNLQFLSIASVKRYLVKHRDVICYVDNHVDFYNSGKNFFSKYFLHGLLWRFLSRSIEPYIKKFYGVLPARVDFLVEVYGLPMNKVELLHMGIDDNLKNAIVNSESKQGFRRKLNIQDSDFVIVTGGKINKFRPETLNLMKAINMFNNSNVKLVIFGTISKELSMEFECLLNRDKMRFAGWLNQTDTLLCMSIADLIVFPGLHSVMWEQSVALGIPGIYRRLEGFDHIDCNGNAILLSDVSTSDIYNCIRNIIEDPIRYANMKNNARNIASFMFSYSHIAKRSLEIED